ncbi:MAG: hypothetical protein QOJ27_631, partial [Sphingomonadales bacterium]|nr:hypothetical protein [Sphingomonadales bacterium]
ATSNVSLANMAITGNSNGGVVGNNAVDFTLTDSTLTNNGSSANEGAVYMTGLTGTSALLGNVIGGSSGDNVHIVQTGGSLALTIADSGSDQAIMGTVNTVTGNDSVFVGTSGTASLTLDVDGVDFQGARGDLLQVLVAGNSTQDLTIVNNNFHNAQAGSVGGGVTLNGGGTGTNINVDFRVEDNSFTGAVDTALTALYGHQAGMVRGNIEGNTIGLDNGVVGTEGSSSGSGIFVGLEKADGPGDAGYQVNIVDNNIADVNGLAGIFLRSNGGDASNSAILEATVTGNQVGEFGDSAFAALAAQIGGSGAAVDFGQLGLVLSDNVFDLGDAGFGGNAVYLEQDSLDSHFYFPGYAGSPDGEFLGGTASADLDTFWTGMGNAFTNGGFPNFPGGVDAGGVMGATGEALVFPVWP